MKNHKNIDMQMGAHLFIINKFTNEFKYSRFPSSPFTFLVYRGHLNIIVLVKKRQFMAKPIKNHKDSICIRLVAPYSVLDLILLVCPALLAFV